MYDWTRSQTRFIWPGLGGTHGPHTEAKARPHGDCTGPGCAPLNQWTSVCCIDVSGGFPYFSLIILIRHPSKKREKSIRHVSPSTPSRGCGFIRPKKNEPRIRRNPFGLFFVKRGWWALSKPDSRTQRCGGALESALRVAEEHSAVERGVDTSRWCFVHRLWSTLKPTVCGPPCCLISRKDQKGNFSTIQYSF